MQFFLKQPAALAHFDNNMIKRVQPLRELSGPQPQRGLENLRPLLVEAAEHQEKAGQLTMQAHACAAQPSQFPAQIGRVVGTTPEYADVRNLSFWFPRGSVTKGSNLDPAAGNFGTDFFQEQEFDTGEKRQEFNVILQRMKDDSQGARRIEWELIIK